MLREWHDLVFPGLEGDKTLTVFDDVGDVEKHGGHDPVVNLELLAESRHL
jgi:hypothetical protein